MNEHLRTRLRAWLTAYFQAMRQERDLSANTLQSYKDTWRLLLEFGREHRGMAASENWRLGQVDRGFVLDFLEYVETGRGCCAATRNVRLAAIQSFFAYLRDIEASLRDHCTRILAIHSKRSHRSVVGCLDPDELHGVLDGIDLARPDGMRDLAILCFAYNTGARVHEIAALRRDWLDLNADPSVRIWGKGNKQRELPLRKPCAHVLRIYLRDHRRPPRKDSGEPFVFIGQRGDPMTRFGVADAIQRAFRRAARTCPSLRRKHLTAHSMRHTTAVHLLQSGTDLVSIQNWLGHESMETVRTYLSLDLNAKRQVLERCLTLDYVLTRLDPHPGDSDTADEAGNWLDNL